MERQKEAFEGRYATKMGKILTKLSKETDKARVQAASTKTSPFQVPVQNNNRGKRPALPVLQQRLEGFVTRNPYCTS